MEPANSTTTIAVVSKRTDLRDTAALSARVLQTLEAGQHVHILNTLPNDWLEIALDVERRYRGYVLSYTIERHSSYRAQPSPFVAETAVHSPQRFAPNLQRQITPNASATPLNPPTTVSSRDNSAALNAVLIIAGLLTLFGFVAMPWISSLLVSLSGFDLMTNLTSGPFATKNLPWQIYTVWLIPVTACVAIWESVSDYLPKFLPNRRKYSKWIDVLILSGVTLYPFIYLYSEFSKSVFGTALLQSGFWVSAVGIIGVGIISILKLQADRSKR